MRPTRRIVALQCCHEDFKYKDRYFRATCGIFFMLKTVSYTRTGILNLISCQSIQFSAYVPSPIAYMPVVSCAAYFIKRRWRRSFWCWDTSSPGKRGFSVLGHLFIICVHWFACCWNLLCRWLWAGLTPIQVPWLRQTRPAQMRLSGHYTVQDARAQLTPRKATIMHDADVLLLDH